MAPHHLPFPAVRATALAAAAACCMAAQAQAQAQAPAPAVPTGADAGTAGTTGALPRITVTTAASPPVAVGGWGDLPLSRLPLQAQVYDTETLQRAGVERLADLVRLDPAVSDAYNAVGYWDFLAVRGYTLDPRFNYRRDGLPINAETLIPLDNKEAVEILRGVTGLQAGTSAPGGLVNFVVKRPTAGPLRTATLGWRSAGSLLGAVDLSQRFGSGEAFGLRVNAAAERLRPTLHDANGNRTLLALAGDWRLPGGHLLEAEVEHSHRSQPSQPGFSVLGSSANVPSVDPRINLNNQPWSQPVVLDATTASLRYTHVLTADWRLSAQAMTQRLRSDDRLAYPFGCDKEGNYDRYCSDGTFDFYVFQSDGERRRNDVLQLAADGRLVAAGLTHHLRFGVLGSRYEARLQPRLDDGTAVGTGNIDGRTMISTLPPLGTAPNTNRTERTTELFVQDRIVFGPRWEALAGLRHSRLHRESVRTDGSRPTDYDQSVNAPWLGIVHRPSESAMVYASWGRGVESEVAPNRSRYTNAGQALPALLSRQVELGAKGSDERLDWNVAVFDIVRPVSASVGSCGGDNTCTLIADGIARHRGIEAGGALHAGPWRLQGGAQWLHARREGSQNATINGQRPTNVPEWTVKLHGRYAVASVPGLALGAGLRHEGDRMVLPDNSARIPSFTTAGLDGSYVQRTGAATLLWRAGIDNLFDRRAWRESPYQFDHAYLYPLAPRTLRASVQIGW